MSDYAATSHKSSAELAREVEAQRSRVSDTLDEIQHKMSPGQLLDGFMDYTGDGSKEFVQNLGRSVKDNPLPVALVGAGLLWLMTGSGRPNGQAGQHRSTTAGYRPGDSDAWRSDAYDSGGGAGEGLFDKAKQVGEDIAGSVSEAAGGIAESAGRLKHDVGDATRSMAGQVQRQTQNLTHLYEEQPLIGGAIAFALGAALGAALPHTEQEDQLLGETSDSVKEKAAAAAGDLFEEGRDAIGEGYSEIKEKVAGVVEDLKPDGPAREAGQSGSFAS